MNRTVRAGAEEAAHAEERVQDVKEEALRADPKGLLAGGRASGPGKDCRQGHAWSYCAAAKSQFRRRKASVRDRLTPPPPPSR